MFLRATTRKKDGKTHRYWRLVENVRVGRRVIQRTVAQLGELDAEGRLRARSLARHLIGSPEQAQLFDDGHADVAVPVRLKGIRIERPRQFGDVYLALALSFAHVLALGPSFVDAVVPVSPSQQYIYGPVVLITASHSNVFTDFDGGDGTVAIHGYPSDPASTRGVASSHGCIRANPQTMATISQVPAGTPIDINP